MDEWQSMFGQVQSIVRSNQPLQQSLEQLFEFAHSNPTLFEDLEFWSRAENYKFQPDFAVLTDWAKQGLEALALETGWQFLLLDLGDCPEAFRLYRPGGQKMMSEEKFRTTLLSSIVIHTRDIEDCFGSEVLSPFNHLFGNDRAELSDHHVSEIPNSILDWTKNDSDDGSEWHDDSGYLLWLVLGSLALVEPLRDKDFCKAVLKGRNRLYLLSGYEEIFFYAAAVTSEGVSFNTTF